MPSFIFFVLLFIFLTFLFHFAFLVCYIYLSVSSLIHIFLSTPQGLLFPSFALSLPLVIVNNRLLNASLCRMSGMRWHSLLVSTGFFLLA